MVDQLSSAYMNAMNENVPPPAAPGPLAMFRRIPERIRWWIYSIGLTVFAVEGVLDASNLGLLDERVQGVLLGVGALFGFGTAAANTGR